MRSSFWRADCLPLVPRCWQHAVWQAHPISVGLRNAHGRVVSAKKSQDPFGDDRAWQRRKNPPTRATSSFSRWATAWSSSATNRKRSRPAASCCPTRAKDKPTRGKVVSVGDGRLLDSGKRIALQVKVGDRVLFTSYAGDTFKLGTRELLLLREEDILAVIE